MMNQMPPTNGDGLDKTEAWCENHQARKVHYIGEPRRVKKGVQI